ncbi:hypothetical protein [Sinomonas albida]|uniref:hypothetical protein n=1 Tax=Sinomonas albida TaxID=369942 RepID=UPI0030180A79
MLAGDEDGMPEGASVAAVVRAMLDSAVDDLVSAYELARTGSGGATAVATLVRGTVELSGVGMFVLTGSERRGRQQRALRVVHDSYQNAAKFFTQLSTDPISPPPVREEASLHAKKNAAECGKVADAALRLGIKKTHVTAKLDRTGLLREVDQARDTQFFSRWQLCSGYAHGLAWAHEFFNKRLYTHTIEGGGVIIGGTLDGDRLLSMLGWGRHAIEDLLGTFAAGRASQPDMGPDATLVSGPPEKVKAMYPGVPVSIRLVID